ncbi:MAG: DegT/DnrJ/EryC1/StrS family aminotransferase [Anaerolineae bacterium]|nr:DegT/DnrJ/EryC1/StrS family aminotransferase [Anaerolineae bacterium]
MSVLAIHGGEPTRTIPFPEWPIWDEREERLLLEVLHSGRWGILNGDKVARFERAFGAFQGAEHVLCVTSGTSALEIAMRALGIGPGDEVITTPYTFVATPSAAFLAGAVPVFVDVDPRTYLIDPALIEGAVTLRTRAIVPVHIGGCPCDMDGILDVAERHGLYVLEDACQAWGASWRDRPVGAIGDLGCFSFQASKNINAGEGGAIVTNNPELAERCWSLHNVGRIRDGAWYQHEFLGWNYRMTEWQGAVLLAQLERLSEHMARRADNASYLSQRLADVDGILPAHVDPRVTAHAWHLYIATYDPHAFGEVTCRAFLAMLRAEGIPCSAGYVPLNHSPAIRRALAEQAGAVGLWDSGEADLPTLPACPVAEELCQRTIWLQQSMLLGDHEDMDDIVAAIVKIQRAVG